MKHNSCVWTQRKVSTDVPKSNSRSGWHGIRPIMAWSPAEMAILAEPPERLFCVCALTSLCLSSNHCQILKENALGAWAQTQKISSVRGHRTNSKTQEGGWRQGQRSRHCQNGILDCPRQTFFCVWNLFCVQTQRSVSCASRTAARRVTSHSSQQRVPGHLNLHLPD